ncbi:T-cell receptor alpha chain V region CTL-L17 [Tupaia chinensis]|nr:T-cell receptor alpha chain V region CTL-L17 [Tupaia chinensis]
MARRKESLGASFMVLCLLLNWVSGQKKDVVQSPSILAVWERETAVINCSYTDGASNYFPWYKQEAGKGPSLLIEMRSNVNSKQDRRFTLLLDKNAKHISLHITPTQPEDSASYFCIASTQCSSGTCSLSSNC